MTEQEAFEAWAKTEGLEDRLAPHPTIKDVYRDDYVDDLWDGWKARAGLAPFHAEKGAVDDRMNQYEHIGSGLPLLRCPCGYCVQTRAILQAATRDVQIPTADQIYAELKGVAVTRTSPENICDVLAVIKRLHIAASAPKGDGNE